MTTIETYKIYVNDRSYSSWSVYETSNFQKVDMNINPVEEKMFSNDVFILNNKTSKVEVVHSSIRSGPAMPGVLILEGNKTYGRQNKKNTITTGKKANTSNNGKLFYKCVPDDMRLPPFLVPYEIKHVGFSKVFKNLYVTFSYDSWEDKHPHGILSQVIGPVDVLDNFYEYQLYCKSLNASIQKFNKDTSKALENKCHDVFISSMKIKYPCIEDRTDQKQWHIFTIDGANSLDLDDAISIKKLDNNIHQLSIYISNVTIWMDVLNLWESFSRRISTIYLPDKKRPMLPTILSDCLCSLQENVTRIAFVMDVFIQNNEITNIKYANAMIKVAKNYTYESNDLLADDDYKYVLDITKNLTRKYKYINNVRNSNELVCYLMILMNYNCAKELLKYNAGVFRSTVMKRDVIIPETVPEEVCKFIKIWNSACGQYIDCADLKDAEQTIRHELMDIDAYIHITSPIRRLVDLLNIIKFQQVTGMIQLSENVDKFYNKWLQDLDYINVTMRSIRKVQCDCTLLNLCANHPDIMEKEYDGYLFDKIYRNDCLYQYIVFLPELKLSSRITLRDNMENYSSKKFKLYLFNDEENFKKKIRLHMV